MSGHSSGAYGISLAAPSSGSARRHRNAKRDSVYDATQAFRVNLDETLEQLREIWDQCGILDEKRGDRVSTVYEHLNMLLQQMLEEETEMHENLCKLVKKYAREVTDLRNLLQLEPYKIDDRLSLVEKEETLHREAEELRAVRDHRLSTAKELKDRDQALCDRLYAEPYFIHSDCVPSNEQLAALEQHVRKMQSDLDVRMAEFKEAKDEIGRLFRKMQQRPSLDFEKCLLCEPEDEFILSPANMNCVRVLLAKTRDNYEQFKQQIRARINEVKQELEQLWEKCHVSAADRNAAENFSEDVLALYRSEVERWTAYFQARQYVLTKVEEWHTLWRMKMDYDQKNQDPNRYKNRGGVLEKQLKTSRTLERSQLPQSEKELSAALDDWKEQHPNEPIILNGMPPLTYIKTVRDEYEISQQQAKTERDRVKQEQNLQETRFGTPLKRKATPSPSKRALTPSKSRTQMGVSNLATVRSPMRNRPPGLPAGPHAARAATPKRRAMADAQNPSSPVHPQNETLVSVRSYGAFTNGLAQSRSKQSSFIQSNSPPKQARRYAP